MDKNKQRQEEERQEEIIAEQIRQSYQSGLIEPDVDSRASEKR